MTERLDTEIYGDDEEQTFDLTIRDTGQPLALAVQITSGEMDVEVTDDDTLTVTITPEGGRGADPVARVAWDGQRLEIHPVKATGISRALRGSGAYDVVINVPRRQMTTDGGAGVTGRLSTASGEIRVDDLTGDLRVDSASGDISVARIAGRFEGRAASGDIHAEELHGEIRLAVTSGDVNLSESVIESLSLNAVSGDANIEIVPIGRGAIEVATVSGAINVELGLAPESGRFALDVQTLSGSVDVEGAAECRSRRSWRLGNGTGDERAFRVRTVSGDVNVEASAGTLPDDFPGLPTMPAAGKTDGAGPKTDDRSEGPSDWQRIVGDLETGIGDVLAGLGRSVTPPTPPTPPTPEPPARPVVPSPSPTPAPAPDPPVSRAAKGDHVQESSVPTATEAVPAATDSERERLEILRGLEQGRIDVEEAMARLDRLGPSGA